MPIGEHPIAGYSYHVEISGVTMAQFKSAEGLGIKIGVIEHRENKLTGLPVLKKLPGHVQYSDITLKRGKVNDKVFWDWIKQVADGDIDGARKEGSVVLFDYAHGEVGRFDFEGAWPSDVNVGALDAAGDEVLLESLTITIEKLNVPA
ncbi:MAG: phage tail protein [Actinomycetota bacterium]